MNEKNDKAWSDSVAWLVVDALMDAEIVKRPDLGRAQKIAQEEILVRLALEDRPPRQG
jgi:hypothetical protein